MDNQTIKPTQNVAGPVVTPEASPPAPITPAPMPEMPASFNADSAAVSSLPGRLSLILSSLAVGVFILLIFVSSLVDSLAKAYIWFFIILVLGVAGLIFGLRSEKNKERINLLGLLGIILSVIVCINCLIIGSYYIKLQIELNKIKSQFNTQSSSDFSSSPYGQ